MSWKSGGRLFKYILDSIDRLVADHDVKVELISDLIVYFEDTDCDVLYEYYKEGFAAFDEAWEIVHPDYLENLENDDDS